MKLKLLILALSLSIVVRKTDSCSSIVGWKSRHVDKVPNNDIKMELTTQKIDTDDNKKFVSIRRSYKQKNNPIIIPIGATIERCESSFEEVYCSGRGICFRIEYNTGNITSAECVCNAGFTGNQCLDKSPDNEYITLKAIKDAAQEVSIQPLTPNEVVENLRKPVPCPPSENRFCVHGECFMFPHLSTDDFFCNCHHDFIGTRCEQKVADYHYDTLSRKKRQIPVEKPMWKNRINPRFRILT